MSRKQEPKMKKRARDFLIGFSLPSLVLASWVAGAQTGKVYGPRVFEELKSKIKTEARDYSERKKDNLPKDCNIPAEKADSVRNAPNKLETRVSNANIQDNYFSKEQLDIINYTASRVGVDPNLLKAIRRAENGGQGLEFGIIPTKHYDSHNGYVLNGKETPYSGTFEKQCANCANTIKRNLERFQENPEGKTDFIDFLAEKYCPIGAKNDPNRLNQNWIPNVRRFYRAYSSN